MGWFQQLHKTYDACYGQDQFSQDPLPPIGFSPQKAQVEVVINGRGEFLRASIVDKKDKPIYIPATEKSASRSGTDPAPHPLCDKIEYLAADYLEFTDEGRSFHHKFLELLGSWCSFSRPPAKIRAIFEYIRKGTLVRDLIEAKILHLGPSGKLLADSPTEKAPIFGVLQKGKGQGSAVIRWCVEIEGERESRVWKDPEVITSWKSFNDSLVEKKGLCMITGGEGIPLASSHPNRLRTSRDMSKLVSSNDKTGFTFRGMFTDQTGDQACGIGYEVSQKAHIALRWLIERQGSRTGERVTVAWEIHGDQIPDPMGDTFALLGDDSMPSNPGYRGDMGQSFSLALRETISGYKKHLHKDSTVVLMAVDAATPGRMAVAYYREWGGEEFLDRLETWHERYSWTQRTSPGRTFIGAPAPTTIAEAAYGQRLDDRLKASCIERLLPCITDGRPVPSDLLESTFQRTVFRIGKGEDDWEKTLGVACALFRGENERLNRGTFDMSLQLDCTNRDYLFGRLLAYAEHLENRALRLGGEKRDTHAAKMMQRYSLHPCTTWNQIWLSLSPARSRLNANSSTQSTLFFLEKEVDSVMDMFERDQFIDDRKLSGEFLLGYHCQRAALVFKSDKDKNTANQPETPENDETPTE